MRRSERKKRKSETRQWRHVAMTRREMNGTKIPRRRMRTVPYNRNRRSLTRRRRDRQAGARREDGERVRTTQARRVHDATLEVRGSHDDVDQTYGEAGPRRKGSRTTRPGRMHAKSTTERREKEGGEMLRVQTGEELNVSIRAAYEGD